MPLRATAKAAFKSAIVRGASFLPRRPAGMRSLMYHSVVEGPAADDEQMAVPAELLDSQLAYLRDGGYQVCEAGSAVERLRVGADLPDRAVVLTFDDGYDDNRRLALPLLERYRVPATIFLIADALDGRLSAAGGRTYLDGKGAREMAASGLITFGCHSATHRNLRGVPSQDLARETAGAKERLEDALGVPVPLFAYPFGSFDAFDDRVVDAVQRAGFMAAFTSIVGPNTARTDMYALRRSRISWAERVPSFKRLLAGGYDWYGAVQWLHAHRARTRATT